MTLVGAAEAPATPAAPAAADAASAAPAESAAPLEENGLIAQILVQVDRWNDSFEMELRRLYQALRALPATLQGFGASFASEAGQALLMRAALLLLAVFAISLILEWALRHALAPLRRALIEHATAPQAPASTHDSDLRMQPSAEAAAPFAKPTVKHMGKLRQLPFALGVLLLDLLPLALFFFVTALLLHWLGGGNLPLRHMVRSMVGAYVGTRAAAAVLRFLIAPEGSGVAMLRVRPDISGILYFWLRRIIAIAAFGIGIANAAQGLGAGLDERIAFMKIVSLLVHSLAVVLILRIRRPVAELIAAPPSAGGPLALARNRLAALWAWFAAGVVIGIWVLWALGVQDGFPRLVQFIAETAGVIIVGRIVAILVLGALGRIFHPGEEDLPAAATPAPVDALGARLRAERYYLLTQRVLSVAIGICTLIALLQVWGFDVIGWLTQRPIGRSLLSALLTIAIAVIVGLVVWETVNAAMHRRLAAWSALGDQLRAARLRTLLPILRTCLFIVIVLVVGLTALNQIGINTAPLLASTSIVGVAIGFGSQKLVQDFITGIFLLMENAMQVGDWVTVAGVSGSVENLSIRTVRLRAGDGSLHIVPFSSVSTVNNSNRGLGNAVMRVSVVYGSDIERVIAQLKQIGAELRADPAFADKMLGDLEIWGVDAVDGSTVTVAGQIRCTDKGRWPVQRELNRRILERFSQLGIQIADPRTSVLLPRAPQPPAAAQEPASKGADPV